MSFFTDKLDEVKNNDKGNLKKILFTVGILAAMGLVFFIVFSLLNAGNKIDYIVTPNEVTLYIGENLSNDINRYATFDGIDSSKCSLDTQDVNVTSPGEYKFTITCSSQTYEGKVIVSAEPDTFIDTKVVFKKVGETVNPIEFSNDITAKFTGDVSTSEIGIFRVNINVNNIDSIATLVVVSDMPKIKFDCVSSDKLYEDISIFDENNNLINVYRISYKIYESRSEYDDNVISQNTSVALDTTKAIGHLELLTREVLNNEYGSSFPTSLKDINNYYRQTKGYTCKYVK